MTDGSHSPTTQAGQLGRGLSLSGLPLEELRAGCWAIGDSIGIDELRAVSVGEVVLPNARYDVVAQALNDRLVDLGLEHLVLYSWELES